MNIVNVCLFEQRTSGKIGVIQLTSSLNKVIIIIIIVHDISLQPNFGASLHILKIEIGGDTESSGKYGS